jgi:hypothetical protein
VKVWIERRAGFLPYEVCIGSQAGKWVQYAAGVNEDGSIRWETQDWDKEVPVFLSLEPTVLEALARAIGDVTQTSDATRDHLSDARATRDRLLALVEKGWEQ